MALSGIVLVRKFSTTLTLCGKKNFRKFPLHNKRGTRQYKQEKNTRERPEYLLGVRNVGYTRDNEFTLVPEMVPELIVPDLTGFKLMPYVSYKVADVVQSEFTAADLFDACYSGKIEEDFKAGRLDNAGNPLEPSPEEKMNAEEAWIKARQTGSDIFCPQPPPRIPIDFDEEEKKMFFS